MGTVISMVGVGIAIISNIVVIVWFIGRLNARMDVMLERINTTEAKNEKNISVEFRKLEQNISERFDRTDREIGVVSQRVSSLEAKG